MEFVAKVRLPPPRDLDEARERMRGAAIPAPILAVLHTLDEAGHHGVVVGGAVRDALLGLAGVDWDVASDATPDEVIRLFPRTIPTGIEHGTVTVLSGRGDQRHAVELTTFRGEGAYHDGRRPSEVTFLRELELDLARRDLTINAFAWDPVNAVFTDAFGGLDDLRAGRIRAVGDPATRFAEDGLRTMRAVRFAATMGFELDPATEAAIAGALAVFDRVSRERVRVELVKLLAARRPSLGLWPMARTGLWSRVLAELAEPERSQAIAAVDRMAGDPIVRLARLLWPIRAERERIEALLEALRPSREERAIVLALTEPALDRLEPLAAAGNGPGLRRLIAGLGRPLLAAAIDMRGLAPEHAAIVHAELEGAALTGKELAIKGRDLIAAGVAQPGKQLGERLEQLLDWVLDDPRRNHADTLLARARELA
ncbi:CCA tRNA nucleotidyltransferase [Nannocystaceae bacterium ST9]